MKTCPRCGGHFPDTAKFCMEDGAPLEMELVQDPLLGRLVDGRYRLQSELGRGGYGAVYSALDERVQRSVAVKVLSAKLTGQPSEIERFKLEAQTLANLQHPNIVPLFDFGHDPDVGFFICMQLLHGETLAQRLRRGPLPILDFYFVARHVARALSAAHKTKIIHRDIKTDNVFLERDKDSPQGYVVRLLDFGLVKIPQLSARASPDAPVSVRPRYTVPGMVVGTPLLMAPEAIEGYDVDARADIYALGGVFYEIITGVEPFVGGTTDELITDKLRGKVVPPSAQPHSGWVPPELDSLILSMLARYPPRRPATVDLALAELERIQMTVEDAWASHHLTSNRGKGGELARADHGQDGARTKTPARAAYRVLVAEDDRLQRKLIRAIVEKGGYTCETLERGDAVLEWLVKNPLPDVMILDILMPGIDGISLLRRLRARGFQGPVIVCSGLSSGAIRAEVEGLGAVQFVNKSTDLSQVGGLLTAHFEAKQRAGAAKER